MNKLCESYESAVDAARRRGSRTELRNAAWRAIFLRYIHGEPDTARRLFSRAFSPDVLTREVTQCSMTELLARWALGELPDDVFVSSMGEIDSQRGTSTAWFVIGERARVHDAPREAGYAFVQSLRDFSAPSTDRAYWAGLSAERRLYQVIDELESSLEHALVGESEVPAERATAVFELLIELGELHVAEIADDQNRLRVYESRLARWRAKSNNLRPTTQPK